jgi:opacity protein-like surface antigen
MNKAIAWLLAVSFVAPGLAQDAAWFVSGSIGRSEFNSKAFTYAPSDFKDNDTQFGLGIGYQFSPALATELGYLSFGKARRQQLGNTVSNDDVTLRSAHASLLLSAPIDQYWQVFGRLGVAQTDQKISSNARSVVTGTVSSSSNTEKTSEALFGVGLGYAINKNVSGTLEFQKLSDTGVFAANIGVRIRL